MKCLFLFLLLLLLSESERSLGRAQSSSRPAAGQQRWLFQVCCVALSDPLSSLFSLRAKVFLLLLLCKSLCWRERERERETHLSRSAPCQNAVRFIVGRGRRGRTTEEKNEEEVLRRVSSTLLLISLHHTAQHSTAQHSSH